MSGHHEQAPLGSYREFLSPTSLIGGASVLNIVIGLVRSKLLALIIGPVGIGTIGLLSAIMTTVALIAEAGVYSGDQAHRGEPCRRRGW